MVFLKKFNLLSEQQEFSITFYKKNIFNSIYPFNIFPTKEMRNITFAPITIFYGGNGSGKTTLLNIIGSKLKASKKNLDNKGELFEQYIERIDDYELSLEETKEIKMISSDDVFDYLLDLRAINSKINRRKKELENEYINAKFSDRDSNLLTYEELKNRVDSHHMTESKYIRTRLTNNNIIEQSNGESALEFWENEIHDNAIYLLDEPENSLSAENQVKLAQFILESARFYNCQFIISTHSPFLLSMQEACIYDLDSVPVKVSKWTDLKNVRVYYDFFESHKDEF